MKVVGLDKKALFSSSSNTQAVEIAGVFFDETADSWPCIL